MGGRSVLILLATLTAVGLWLNQAPATSRDALWVATPGASAGTLLADLESQGHIRSRFWARIVLAISGGSRRLRAGGYQLKKGNSTGDILHQLLEGRGWRPKVLLPEGFSSAQMADRLSEAGVTPAMEFRQAVAQTQAEGYLFPETYFFDLNQPASTVVDILRRRFLEEWRESVSRANDSGRVVALSTATLPWEGEQLLLNGRRWSAHELVTLASIVEREAQLPEERPRIAGVYMKRLKVGMPLQADPTVQFALGGWKQNLSRHDLGIPSLYNTYRHPGLPPGPICNPGRASLDAVLAPFVTGDLYFVADDTGGHHFSKTLAEHNRWVQALRQKNNAKQN